VYTSFGLPEPSLTALEQAAALAQDILCHNVLRFEGER